MRFISLLLLLTSVAGAQEYAPPPPAVSAPALDFMRAPPDENAIQRGKGAMLLTLGTITLTVSLAMLGTSALAWSGYSSACSDDCYSSSVSFSGAVALDVIGIAAFAGAAAMLAIGAQKYVEHKKPRFAWNGNGFAF